MLALCAALAPAAFATTYYVSPSGSGLSTSSSSPGSLSYTAANAGSGSTVILENGTYDSASTNGITVANSSITFQAQTWHGATIKNSTNSNLVSPGSSNPTGDIWQGVVFGPSTGLGWSGGGGASWQFLDCVFTQTGGVGAGDSCVFKRCLFTDAYSNSFDLAGNNQSVIDCIARRGNRVSADSDAVGNKEDGAQNLVFNDFIAYDNNGAALWFDTDNDNWTIENSTFFGNHGGNNWYYGGVGSGISTTQFTAYGQDGQQFTAGQPILGLSGVDNGAQSVITNVSGYNPATLTVSPALPSTPAANDQFAVQQDGASVGVGFITEANDNGTFTNNWVYSNTDYGYFDHSSGGTTYGGTGGLTVDYNLFAYNPQGFFVWSDARDQGPATVEHNQFKFLPGTSSAFDSWGSTPGQYPYLGSITFDYNDYNPDNGNGGWAAWFGTGGPYTAGGLTAGSPPSGQDYLQNPSTWNQDYHSNTNAVTFYGTPPAIYVWPAATDTSWSDNYFPNNTFGLSNSIHQINDTNGAVSNTIDAAIAGKAVNSVVTIPVSAHTPITGSGPYSCEVYDLNGRWVTLSIPTANLSGFESAVPPYVTCGASNATQTYNIQVTLNSTPPYNVTATYNPGGGGGYGGSLSGNTATASTSTYNLTSLGSADWAHWNGTFNHKSSGGTQISNVTQIGSGNYGTWHDTSRNVSWSDGTPVGSNSDDQNYIWCNNVANAGWTFTAPADTTTRTLVVMWGGPTGASVKLNAHLSDDTGHTVDYTDTKSISVTIGTYIDTITYKAASAGQTLTVTLTNTSGSVQSVDLDGAWLSGGGVTGSLSGNNAGASGTYNLSSLGTTDWRQWGDSGGSNHDSSGGTKISDVTQIGGGNYGTWNSFSNETWSGGTPTASSGGDTNFIWCNNVTNAGWTFTVPADTTSRTISVLWGGATGTTVKLNAHLSDGSAADYSDTKVLTGSGSIAYVETITYNAASASQTLTLTLTNTTNSASSVDLAAAWLH